MEIRRKEKAVQAEDCKGSEERLWRVQKRKGRECGPPSEEWAQCEVQDSPAHGAAGAVGTDLHSSVEGGGPPDSPYRAVACPDLCFTEVTLAPAGGGMCGEKLEKWQWVIRVKVRKRMMSGWAGVWAPSSLGTAGEVETAVVTL